MTAFLLEITCLSRRRLALIARGRFSRFLAVGALNTLFGYGVFYLILTVTSRPLFSLVVSTVIGVLFNFRSMGSLVFNSSDGRLIFRFLSVYGLLFILNAIALDILRRQGIEPARAQIVLIAPLALLSYWLNSGFVFQRRGNARA